jgi:ribosomal 50S subunit-recycling heat shock protein
MRLDLFLKSSRLCLRRTVAQKMCDAGLVSVNGKVAKAATTVKAGDELSLRRRDRITTIRVLALPAARQTSRSEATSLYEIIGEVGVVEGGNSV